MTQDPSLPFQPPGGPQPGGPQPGGPQPGGPRPGGPRPGGPRPGPSPGSAGYAVVSVAFGVAWGYLGPIVVGTIISNVLNRLDVYDLTSFIVSILGAAVIVIGVFVLVIKQLDPEIPDQLAASTGVKVSLAMAIISWALLFLLAGLCIAIATNIHS